MNYEKRKQVITYEVNWTKGVDKDLRPLTDRQLAKLLEEIDKLKSDPNSTGTKRIKNLPGNTRRIKIDDYRLFYLVEEATMNIYIIGCMKRKDCYKGKSTEHFRVMVKALMTNQIGEGKR